jgi:hypothetical protein
LEGMDPLETVQLRTDVLSNDPWLLRRGISSAVPLFVHQAVINRPGFGYAPERATRTTITKLRGLSGRGMQNPSVIVKMRIENPIQSAEVLKRLVHKVCNLPSAQLDEQEIQITLWLHSLADAIRQTAQPPRDF